VIVRRLAGGPLDQIEPDILAPTPEAPVSTFGHIWSSRGGYPFKRKSPGVLRELSSIAIFRMAESDGITKAAKYGPPRQSPKFPQVPRNGRTSLPMRQTGQLIPNITRVQ
jgi:hypothetical protein